MALVLVASVLHASSSPAACFLRTLWTPILRPAYLPHTALADLSYDLIMAGRLSDHEETSSTRPPVQCN
jgi:hypothetical protein